MACSRLDRHAFLQTMSLAQSALKSKGSMFAILKRDVEPQKGAVVFVWRSFKTKSKRGTKTPKLLDAPSPLSSKNLFFKTIPQRTTVAFERQWTTGIKPRKIWTAPPPSSGEESPWETEKNGTCKLENWTNPALETQMSDQHVHINTCFSASRVGHKNSKKWAVPGNPKQIVCLQWPNRHLQQLKPNIFAVSLFLWGVKSVTMSQ